jgi:hypothetical protein
LPLSIGTFDLLFKIRNKTESTAVNVKATPCPKDQFEQKSVSLMCVDDENVFGYRIQGNYFADLFKYFELSVKPCDSFLNVCSSPEEIAKFF